jgi:poly(hydroxyalkanoate) granule-associated protein
VSPAVDQEIHFKKKEASMARKTSSRRRSSTSGNETAQAVRGSAQKIWLAGLGAYERAKSEGPKMFESLVEQGRSMGARAVGAADEAMKNMRQASSAAGGRWDKLEQVFEDRVSKSLGRLGVLTGREVESLSRQVADLNETVRSLMRGADRAAKGGSRRAKGGAKRAKTTAKRATTKAKRAASTVKRSAAQRTRKSGSKAKASKKAGATRE